MKNLLLFLIVGLIISCNSPNRNSKDSFDKQFDENFKEDLKELAKMMENEEWKKTEPIGNELQCPCCDYFTLEKRGQYDICPICFWEDDGIDIDNLDMHSGPNHITLRQGRQNFKNYGACDSSMVKNVLTELQRKKFKLATRIIE